MQTITLLGRAYLVALPDYTTRDELVLAQDLYADGPRVWRVMSAAVGLCTGAPADEAGKAVKRLPAAPDTWSLAALAGADYARAKCDPLAYGASLYELLRTRGVELEELAAVGKELLRMCRERQFPSLEAIAEKKASTAPSGG